MTTYQAAEIYGLGPIGLGVGGTLGGTTSGGGGASTGGDDEWDLGNC